MNCKPRVESAPEWDFLGVQLGCQGADGEPARGAGSRGRKNKHVDRQKHQGATRRRPRSVLWLLRHSPKLDPAGERRHLQLDFSETLSRRPE